VFRFGAHPLSAPCAGIFAPLLNEMPKRNKNARWWNAAAEMRINKKVVCSDIFAAG
jgi:hypothetical protein